MAIPEAAESGPTDTLDARRARIVAFCSLHFRSCIARPRKHQFTIIGVILGLWHSATALAGRAGAHGHAATVRRAIDSFPPCPILASGTGA